jgi:hypothetical protein
MRNWASTLTKNSNAVLQTLSALKVIATGTLRKIRILWLCYLFLNIQRVAKQILLMSLK